MTQQTMIKAILEQLEKRWLELLPEQGMYEAGQRDGLVWAMEIVDKIKEAPAKEPQCGD